MKQSNIMFLINLFATPIIIYMIYLLIKSDVSENLFFLKVIVVDYNILVYMLIVWGWLSSINNEIKLENKVKP